jgi:4-hydroxy-2-oxoheptanedioate aldolase
MTSKGYLEQSDLQVKAPFRAPLLTYPGNLRDALRESHEDASKTLFGVGQGIPSVALTKVCVKELKTRWGPYIH